MLLIPWISVMVQSSEEPTDMPVLQSRKIVPVMLTVVEFMVAPAALSLVTFAPDATMPLTTPPFMAQSATPTKTTPEPNRVEPVTLGLLMVTFLICGRLVGPVVRTETMAIASS